MFKLNKENKKKILIFAFAVSLLLASSLTPAIRNPFIDTLKHPLKILALIQREFRGIIFYHHNFIQNEKLKQQIDLLRNRLVILEELYQENTRLKNMLSLKQGSPYKIVAAKVIGRSPDSWSSSIIIDKGRHNGLKPGMAVITYLGLVGRVQEAGNYTSKVILINDPNFAVSCIVQRSRQEGLVSGVLGPNLIMRYLPQSPDVKVQDTVITSGLNPAYPKGLVIGTVVDMGVEFSGLSSFALIKPAVNLSNIEELLIIVS